jgi:hypothetical protein
MTKDQFSAAKNWIADAPLFIDAPQVERFFDAVASPEARLGIVTVTLQEEDTVKELSETGKSGGLNLKLFSGSASKKASTESGEATGKNRAVIFEPIRTPERQLRALLDHYQDHLPDRAFYVANPTEEDWRDPKTISAVPRALAFLDLPGEAEAAEKRLATVKLIPTAAEFENGRVIPIFAMLRGPNGEEPPRYPERPKDERSVQDLRREYWAWFEANFSARMAMEAVEKNAAENGRIRWIDYRVPVTPDGETLHLHFQAAGRFDTGVFAYYLIKRGFKHGLRLVGTLKSEPDMDVLAIYEK